MIKRIINVVTNRLATVPILVLMPHSRCNCRCVMCDIWKANKNRQEISDETLEKHLAAFKRLGVREVVFSGGEALMHSNLWKLCSMLLDSKIRITLLSTGLTIEDRCNEIVEHVDEVIVSLDGSQPVHDVIRNIPNAFEKLANGVRALKRLSPAFKIKGRCVIQRFNFLDYPNIILSAKQIGLDQISFLAADTSSSAFNREQQWTEERVHEIALTKKEANQLERILNLSFSTQNEFYSSGFIAESKQRLLRMVQYYRAINGEGQFPPVVCNAPWVSAVIESDGEVLPCFFHKSYGNIYDDGFDAIINSRRAIQFRKDLKVDTDKTCERCVCSLHVGLMKRI